MAWCTAEDYCTIGAACSERSRRSRVSKRYAHSCMQQNWRTSQWSPAEWTTWRRGQQEEWRWRNQRESWRDHTADHEPWIDHTTECWSRFVEGILRQRLLRQIRHQQVLRVSGSGSLLEWCASIGPHAFAALYYWYLGHVQRPPFPSHRGGDSLPRLVNTSRLSDTPVPPRPPAPSSPERRRVSRTQTRGSSWTCSSSVFLRGSALGCITAALHLVAIVLFALLAWCAGASVTAVGRASVSLAGGAPRAATAAAREDAARLSRTFQQCQQQRHRTSALLRRPP